MNTDHRCLVCACFHEDRSGLVDSRTGRVKDRNAGLAVLKVIQSRARSPQFPNTVCSVVRQRSQFSFVPSKLGMNIDGLSSPGDRSARRECESIVDEAIEFKGHYGLYFHALTVSPSWARGCEVVGRHGGHIFYNDCSVEGRADYRRRRDAVIRYTDFIKRVMPMPGRSQH